MKRISILCSLLVFAFGMSLNATVHAQTQGADERLSQLTQKPVAVDKLVEATGDADVVQDLARSLNEGEVDPSNFNETMSGAAQTGNREGVSNMGSFVNGQVENGLKGQELANSIHKQLNQLGIPAGGNNAQGPPPIAKQFIPEKAQGKLKNDRQQRGNRPASVEQGGQSDRPSATTRGSSGQRGQSNRPNATRGSSEQSGSSSSRGGRQ